MGQNEQIIMVPLTKIGPNTQCGQNRATIPSIAKNVSQSEELSESPVSLYEHMGGLI